MRHGYYRGDETVRYVEEILNRYRMYMRLVDRDPALAAQADSMAAAAARQRGLRHQAPTPADVALGSVSSPGG